VWLLGLAIRTTTRLFQLVLLITMAGIAFAHWLRQRRKVIPCWKAKSCRQNGGCCCAP
jgi:hypothetical protein